MTLTLFIFSLPKRSKRAVSHVPAPAHQNCVSSTSACTRQRCCWALTAVSPLLSTRYQRTHQYAAFVISPLKFHQTLFKMDCNIIKEGIKRWKIRETKSKGHKLTTLCTTAILLLQYPPLRCPKSGSKMKL